jgi:hypothetical protein
MDRNELFVLKKAFVDICKGYSKMGSFYIKHPHLPDEIDLEEIRQIEEKRVAERGLPTEKERLDVIINEEGSWTEEDEKYIENQKNFLKSLHEAKKHLYLEKQLKTNKNHIKKAEDDLLAKLSERASLLGTTQESWCDKRVSEMRFLRSFYKDEKLTQRLFDDYYIWEIEDDEMEKYGDLYVKFINLVNEENIKKISIQEFFMNSLVLSEGNFSNFFGKPIFDFTEHQAALSTYGRVFREIFKNTPNIPEDIINDPDKILDYAISQKNFDKHKEKMKGDNVSMVGATKEDYKRFGMDSSNSIDLREELDKSGGKITKDEMVKKTHF